MKTFIASAKTFEPLVTRCRTDAETPAKLPSVRSLLTRQKNKLTTLVHVVIDLAWIKRERFTQRIVERADNGRQSNIRKLPVSGSPGAASAAVSKGRQPL